MKALKVLIIIVAILVIVPLLGYAGWLIKKGFNLEVLVVNKSMIEFKGSENMAMNYILNKEKILTSGNRTYNLEVDHIGLHWNEGDYKVKYPRLKEMERVVEKTDLIYFADVKGIRKSQVKSLKEGEEDNVEYGGINNTDYTLLRKFIQQGKTVVIECNFLDPPTEPLIRYNLERIKDVYYAGWRGRYVEDLSLQVPDCRKINYMSAYEEATGESWDYSGAGMVMINDDLSRIVVFEEGKDIETLDGLIHSSENAMEEFGIPAAVNYNGWFSLIHPGENTVHSLYELNPTTDGLEKLKANGLPESFPAMIQVDKNVYYLAGDFGQSDVKLTFSKIMLVNNIISGIKGDFAKNPNNFFYTYFKPFMTKVIEGAVEGKASDE